MSNKLVLILAIAIYISLGESNVSRPITNKFVLVEDTEISDYAEYETEFLIQSVLNSNKIKCLSKCNAIQNCSFALLQKQSNKCLILNSNVEDHLNESTSSNISDMSIYFKKREAEFNLTYVPVETVRETVATIILQYYRSFNNKLADEISNFSLNSFQPSSFISDQSAKPTSAFSVNSAYLQAPQGVYFTDNGFTIMAWIRIKSILKQHRIIDFGNGPRIDNVICGLSDGTTGKPYFRVFKADKDSKMVGPVKLATGVWQHITCMQKGSESFIFVNGLQVCKSTTVKVANPVLRTINYIGKSSLDPNDPLATFDIDELKIFNKPLTVDEINKQMNQFLL